MGQAQAKWNGVLIAETDTYETVEGNIYFPPASLNEQYFEASSHTSVCPWKGLASYKSVVVNGETNQDAAWFYPEPKEKAANIRDHFAFWKGVEVTST